VSRWLVDGMNVVGSRPDGWWRDRRGAQARLAQRLAAFAAATGDEVVVVFDGRQHEIDAPGIEIAFAPAPGPNAADAVIAARVQQDPDPRSLRVVTSDAALAELVRAAGAEVVGAGAFLRRLDEVGV
jgi:predicted RNA-binding protein with PIN domain